MANPFCLIGQHANDFIAAIKSGQLDPVKLQAMDSQARHAEFAKVVGEANAEKLNAEFEGKLLLKNQQAGLVRWITQSTTPGSPLQRDLLARVDRMDNRILNPGSLKDFYADLAKRKLGFGVTMQEAGHITSLAQDVANAKAAGATSGDYAPYGRALSEFKSYTNDLEQNIPQPFTIGRAAGNVFSFSKAINASFDNSALLRQGLPTLFNHPAIWAENAAQSFVDIAKTLKSKGGGDAVAKETEAGIFAKENYRNGYYKRAGLATATTEESFPPSVLEKIPALGRLYKASENAFQGFIHRVRSDVFDQYIDIAKANGETLDTAQLQSIGKLVNSLTGRGHLAKFEAGSEILNLGFFSPRSIKANIDFLTAHQLQKGVTPFVRKRAARNLAQYIAGMTTLMFSAKALVAAFGDDKKDSVETNPLGTDFGQIKIGNTRFDYTGGMRTIAILAARLGPLLAGKQPLIKDAKGHIKKLNTGNFGERTGLDLLSTYFKNKASPIAQVGITHARGHDFEGRLPTIPRDLATLFGPLGVKNVIEASSDPESTKATALAASIADALGINTNTYNATKKRKMEKP